MAVSGAYVALPDTSLLRLDENLGSDFHVAKTW